MTEQETKPLPAPLAAAATVVGVAALVGMAVAVLAMVAFAVVKEIVRKVAH